MRKSLKNWLDEHDINYILHTHPAVFTVPEAKVYCGHITGTHCKNLFLINKKTKQLYLVTIPHDKKLDLNEFRRMVGAPKIRFAEHEILSEVLGISPGAVSPLALINDTENRVIFIVDRKVWNAEKICCHSNVNTETLQIPGSDFRKLIKEIGTSIEIINLPYL